MPTTPKEFHTGGIITPHEFNLFVLHNAAQFYFWDTYLNGMADVFLNAYNFDGYQPPHNDQYANGCFPIVGQGVGV